MEHRLCYGTAQNNTPKKFGATPAASIDLQDPILKHKENQEKLRKHLNITIESQVSTKIQEILNDPVKLENALRMYEISLAERIATAAEMFGSSLQKPEKDISAWDASEMKNIVQKMITDLQTPLPKKGAGNVHRYGTTAGINFDNIESDRKTIEGFLTAKVPDEVRSALEEVKTALKYLAEQDLNHQVWKFLQEKKTNKFDNTIKGMGKTTIIIAALFAGVITGIPAIAKLFKEGKVEFKDLLAPLVCFGIALPLANANVRRMFASLEANMGKDMKVSIRDGEFRELCAKYEIQGPRWSGFFKKMFDKPEEMKKLAANFYSGTAQMKKEDLDKAISAFVEKSDLEGDIKNEHTEKGKLRVMIENGDFANLSNKLSKVITKEGQRVVSEYVGMGARMYEKDAYDNANRIKMAAEGEGDAGK